MGGAGDGARGGKFGGIKFKIKVTGFRLGGRNDGKFKNGERKGAEAKVRENQVQLQDGLRIVVRNDDLYSKP